MKKIYLVFFLLIAFGTKSFATHIRAAEIIATVVDCENYTYLITVNGFTDTGSTVQFGGGELNFGDGTIIEMNTEGYDLKIDLGNEIALNVFKYEHTFPGPGTYTISFREFNRNANIVNMDRSVDTPFYVETQITIDQSIGCNSSPEFMFYPIDAASVGQIFKHNPGAIDPDLDSLSYEIVVNKQFPDLEVNGYLSPNDPSFGGTKEDGQGFTTLIIDKYGTISWDAPGQAGEYALALKVIEWSKIGNHYFKIGYVIRDMQIIAEESDNIRPKLNIPQDTTLFSGVILEKTISVAMENEISMSMVSEAQYMHPEFLKTKFNYDNTLTCTWDLTDMPFQPYTYPLIFFTKDDGRPPLSDFATWNVTVVNQYNQNLNLERVNNEAISVEWTKLEEATGFELWRKLKFPGEVLIVKSDQSLSSQGFEKIGDFAADETTYSQNIPNYTWNNYDVCYQVMAKTSSGDTTLAQKCLDKPSALVMNIDLQETEDLRVYPNPFRDIIRINAPPLNPVRSVILYDLSGLNIRILILEDNQVNVADIAPGSYILKIDTKNGIYTTQLIKH